MKYIITVLLAITVLVVMEKNDVHIPNKVIRSEPTELERFLRHIAWRESQNNPQIINKFGMMGKYQFSPITIRGLGFRVTPKQFLKNEELQDSVMVAYLRLNDKELKYIIKKYDGKIVKGVKVTRSGILAAAHLGGSYSVIEFFSNGDMEGRKDANGTSVREYMKTFSKYNLRNTIL